MSGSAPLQPFEWIGIDFFGPFLHCSSGNRWVIIVVAHLTQYVETAALFNGSAVDVATSLFIHSILLRCGAPRVIISNRGTSFVSALGTNILQLCDTIYRKSTVYHPQTNGIVERFNRALADMLLVHITCDHTNLGIKLPFITFMYNFVVQQTTGYSPLHLLYGQYAALLFDTVSMSSGCASQISTLHRCVLMLKLKRLLTLESQQHSHTRSRGDVPPLAYNVNELVWIWYPLRRVGLSAKLMPCYHGPYCVQRQVSSVNYVVRRVDAALYRQTQFVDTVDVLHIKSCHTLAPHPTTISTRLSSPSPADTTFPLLGE